MTTIRCGDGTVEVHTELSDRVQRDGQRKTVYVSGCCSARYASMKILQTSHAAGCPRDREISGLMDTAGGDRDG